MQNIDIKKQMKLKHICSWEIADRLNIHESTLCKWFRKPLTQERKTLVLSAIEDISLAKIKEQK